MVSDIFTALTEDRPYRKGMERKNIKKILQTLVDNNSIDKRITELLFDNFTEISIQVGEKQALSMELYKKYFQKLMHSR